MARGFTFVDDIVPGRIDWKIRVRVIRLWKLPEFKNPEETNSLEMVLLDEKCARIHASVKRSLLQKFQNRLEEGVAYTIENLLVAKNDLKFRTTKHKYKLNFMGSTNPTKLNAENIPRNYFQFVSFQEILSGMDQGLLFDVIGHVVQKDDIKETEKNGMKTKLFDIWLKDVNDNKVGCTLWGDFAETMAEYLNKNEREAPVIVILQLCKFKSFNGKNGISNAYHGTKLLINPQLKEVAQYKEKLPDETVSVSQAVSYGSSHNSISLADDLLQTQKMNIEDVFDATERGMCCVFATVIEFDTAKGWYYDSCHKCLRKVEAIGCQYYCTHCDKMVVAVTRYKLHLKVIDQTGSTTFVMFDRVVAEYLGKSATELKDSIAAVGDVSMGFPQVLDDLLHKLFIFKIEISQSNVDQTWHTYTVKKFSDDKELIQQFKIQHGIKELNDDDQALFQGDNSQESYDHLKICEEGADSNIKVDLSQQTEDQSGVNVDVVLEEQSVDIITDQKEQAEDQSEDIISDVKDVTPIHNSSRKRLSDFADLSSFNEDSATQNSTTKLSKKEEQHKG